MSQTELLRNRHRDRLLTNSAAEFLETRADMALGAELAQQPPEFVPELDRFMAQDQVVRPDYYQESQDKLKQFQKTLDAFKTTLAEGKFCERYGIEVKETYTVDDVLVVANTIQQQHKDAGEVHSCMGRIRKFFRATGRNSSTLQRFLEFVPNSEYTSTICGGFTIILEALERLESLRTDMYRALGDIPKTMSRIHRHLKVHFQSARLKHCADMVWVSVFTVLEAIIRELSTKSGKKALKALFKGEAHGLNVSEALEDLKASVSEFETEANICDAERLGQVDRTTDETLSVTKRTETSVRQLSQGMSSFCERFEERMERDREALETKQARLLSSTETLLENQKQMLERREEAQAEQVQVNVYNVFYCFLTASPSFDSKIGTLDNYQTGSRLIRSTTPLSMDELRTTLSTASLSPSPSQLSPFGLQQNPAWQSKSKQAVKRWLREAQRPERVSARDLRSCMQDITAQAGADEQDCIAYILASLELRDWLRATTSQVLVVELRQSTSNGRGSQQYFTAASYASTVLARSLARTISSPVLTHLCASRETDPENDVLVGGRGLLISLAGQLVAHLSSLSKQPTRSSTVPDLSFLEDDKRAKFSRTSDSVTKLLALFAKLLSLLPSTSEIVYIILDGIWRLPSESRETKKAIGGLLRLVTRQQLRPSRRGDLEIGSVKIKLIITEPFSTDLHEFLDDDDDDEEGAMDGHDTTLRRHHHHRKSSSSSLPPPPPSRRGYRTELSVPDHVPGSSSGGAGINVSWVDSEVDAMIHEECSSSPSAVHSSVDSDPDAKKDRHGRRRQRKRNDRLSIDSPTTRHGHRRQSRSLFEDGSESD